MGYTDIPAVFVDTGLEYPEIREFIRTFDNVVWLKPRMQFRKVIETYGYPFISKEVSEAVEGARIYLQKGTYQDAYQKLNGLGVFAKGGKRELYAQTKWGFLIDAPFKVSKQCCNVMKKGATHNYSNKEKRVGITAQMAEESMLRTNKWLENGCNGFRLKNPISNPMSFWTEQDVLQYIKQNGITIASVYGNIVYDESASEQLEGQLEFVHDGIEEAKGVLKTTGCKRTGCMFCGFGCHLEKEGEGRFEKMKETHPKQYEWIMRDWDKGGLGYKKVIDWINENGHLNIRY